MFTTREWLRVALWHVAGCGPVDPVTIDVFEAEIRYRVAAAERRARAVGVLTGAFFAGISFFGGAVLAWWSLS